LIDLLIGADIKAILLIGVLQADSVNNELKIIGALGDIEGPEPTDQDMGMSTILLPGVADMDQNPNWTIGPFDLPIVLDGINISIENVVLTGIFEENYNYTGKGEFQGDLDLGVLSSFVGIPPQDICAIVGGCLPCVDDPGRVECVHLYIKNIRGEEKGTPIIPVGAPGVKNLGGAGNEQILELTLLHPETGAPEAGVELLVEVVEGNAQVDGGVQALVNTGADGKVTVSVTDSDGGSNKLNISINVDPGYQHISSVLYVNF
jgi:hypothetical protein